MKLHLENDFYLDGISAKSLGICLQRALTLSAPVPVTESVQVPGRNGTVVISTGAYKNRSGLAECFALQKDVIGKINEINRFLFASVGYRRLEISGDDDHFLMAKVKNGAQIAPRLQTLNPFEIAFDCKPQRFLKSGENTLTFTMPGDFLNIYGFPAKPIVKAYGNGEGTVTIGDTTVRILDMEDHIILDCDTMNAYKGSLNQNLYINAPEFPTLESGTNAVSFSGGITKIEITPRWWEL